MDLPLWDDPHYGDYSPYMDGAGLDEMGLYVKHQLKPPFPSRGMEICPCCYGDRQWYTWEGDVVVCGHCEGWGETPLSWTSRPSED